MLSQSQICLRSHALTTAHGPVRPAVHRPRCLQVPRLGSWLVPWPLPLQVRSWCGISARRRGNPVSPQKSTRGCLIVLVCSPGFVIRSVLVQQLRNCSETNVSPPKYLQTNRTRDLNLPAPLLSRCQLLGSRPRFSRAAIVRLTIHGSRRSLGRKTRYGRTLVLLQVNVPSLPYQHTHLLISTNATVSALASTTAPHRLANKASVLLESALVPNQDEVAMQEAIRVLFRQTIQPCQRPNVRSVATF